MAKNLAALSAACERLGLDRCPADAEAVLLWALENRTDGGRTLGELSPQRAEDAARQFLGAHLVGEYRAREQAG